MVQGQGPCRARTGGSRKDAANALCGEGDYSRTMVEVESLVSAFGDNLVFGMGEGPHQVNHLRAPADTVSSVTTTSQQPLFLANSGYVVMRLRAVAL